MRNIKIASKGEMRLKAKLKEDIHIPEKRMRIVAKNDESVIRNTKRWFPTYQEKIVYNIFIKRLKARQRRHAVVTSPARTCPTIR